MSGSEFEHGDRVVKDGRYGTVEVIGKKQADGGYGQSVHVLTDGENAYHSPDGWSLVTAVPELKPGALVQRHADGRTAKVDWFKYANGMKAWYLDLGAGAERTVEFDEGSLPEGWSLVGSGFAPEGAHLAWVNDDIVSMLRRAAGDDPNLDMSLGEWSIQTLQDVADEFVRLNPPHEEKAGSRVGWRASFSGEMPADEEKT